MSDLLDIVDNSDPLNIKKGNPGLKPSFTQNLRIFYNNYVQGHQRSIATWAGLTTTSNAISNKVTLDKSSGARITQPENIDGNWNTYAGLVFNTALDSAAYFNINSFTNLGYNHYVGYASVNNLEESQKSVTKSANINQRLALSYRNEWLEIELSGGLGYNHSRNDGPMGHSPHHQPQYAEPSRLQRCVDEHQRAHLECAALTGFPQG